MLTIHTTGLYTGNSKAISKPQFHRLGPMASIVNFRKGAETFMESVIQEKLRCPHCLEELDYLDDPRELPCSHMFCMPCMESLAVLRQTGVQVTCSICR